MATQKFKAAINNSAFPFLYSQAEQAVLQPGLDVAPRVGAGFSGAESVDYNTLKLLYCENALPTREGFTSVAFAAEIDAISPAATDFDQLIVLRDALERNFLFSPGRGKNYVYDVATETWVSHDSFVWAADKTLVSRAYVVGRTLIMYERDRVIEWDPVGELFNTITLTLPSGVAITDVRGCCGASNYLIIFTDTTIYWSSVLDITDFDDPVNGSGGQIPIDLKGQITCCVPISGGFIIYTSRNAVAAFFTNNATAPFSFREVLGSGGVASYEQITGDANQAEHYTYGSSGLQRVGLQQAVTIYPACADFLSSRLYERWNATTKEIQLLQLLKPLSIKMQYLANRYLFISYGITTTQFEFALVYDTGLERWGKIRTPHVDIGILPTDSLDPGFRYFELPLGYDNPAYADLAYEDLVKEYEDVLPLKVGFALLQNTGQVDLLLTDTLFEESQAVVVFGHAQVSRNRTVLPQSVKLTGLYSFPAPEVLVLGSDPGNGGDRNAGVAMYNNQTTDKFAEYLTGEAITPMENFDVAVVGAFSLSTLLMETTVHGSR